MFLLAGGDQLTSAFHPFRIFAEGLLSTQSGYSREFVGFSPIATSELVQARSPNQPWSIAVTKNHVQLANDVSTGVHLLRQAIPDAMKGFGGLAAAATATNALDSKTRN